MDQTVVLSTSSLPIALAVLFLITVVPVKLGAGFVGAMNRGFGAAAIAAALGLIVGLVSLKLFSGLMSLIGAYVGVSLVYYFVLKPTLGGAFGLTFVVLILQGAILQGLFRVLG